MKDDSGSRLSGGLIIAAVLGALVLMLHHPTSFEGPDDGLLMTDWSNTIVHGAMIVCLFLFRFAFGTWARRLGTAHASVRAGTIAFDAGMNAFIGAALISGFAARGLAAHGGANPDQASLQLYVFVALNRALANLGMVLTGAAMALWAVRMLRLMPLTRVAGGLGLVVAVVAAGWMVLGRGAFGLYPATMATVLFGAWSLVVAAQMMRTDRSGDAR